MNAKRARGVSALTVTLHTPSGGIDINWPAPATAALRERQRIAIEWTHVVRNRGRWIRSKKGAEEQDERAREFLHGLGVDDGKLRQLAEAGTVRVSIPFTEEQTGWEARILPWEFIISAATRGFRTGLVVVTRWLQRTHPAVIADLQKVLFVESAPGRLAKDWDFGDERRLVEKYTRAKTFERLESPTMAELRATVLKLRPGIIHLTGFDTHQGLELLKDPRASKIGDGYLLAAPGGVDTVTAGALAAAIVPAGHAPSLVFCNIWNSASRVTPLVVAAGAAAAIGFQDGMDDALAEIFLGSFYRGFAKYAEVEAGFSAGWEALQAQAKPLRGTGIVLWRGGLEQRRAADAAHRAPAAAPTLKVRVPTATEAQEVSKLISVAVEPEPQLSYGLLHNNRDLFRRFLLRNLSDDVLGGVEVFVELHSNEGTYPWRQSFTLNGPVLDLQSQVRIALTSTLARTLDEVLRTSLYVQVKWGTHEVFSQTFPVTLAPVDQWTDTDADRIFLPSFIFPRDRAVGAIIRNAEQFATALRDDPAAGFDGYQSLDPDAADPAANIDRQVQALWYSVVYKVPASYINPPPTYAVASQRIRTPSEVVGGGFGTCIDLALLLASCLEAVEIYPVIFLLDDHAFPGYWRTEHARTSFLRRAAELSAEPGVQTDGAMGDGVAARERPGAPWIFDQSTLAEVRRAIDANRLVPLESVGLTGRWSLADAIDGGKEYFDHENSMRFLGMFDIMLARELGVTPLPLGARLG